MDRPMGEKLQIAISLSFLFPPPPDEGIKIVMVGAPFGSQVYYFTYGSTSLSAISPFESPSSRPIGTFKMTKAEFDRLINQRDKYMETGARLVVDQRWGRRYLVGLVRKFIKRGFRSALSPAVLDELASIIDPEQVLIKMFPYMSMVPV